MGRSASGGLSPILDQARATANVLQFSIASEGVPTPHGVAESCPNLDGDLAHRGLVLDDEDRRRAPRQVDRVDVAGAGGRGGERARQVEADAVAGPIQHKLEELAQTIQLRDRAVAGEWRDVMCFSSPCSRPTIERRLVRLEVGILAGERIAALPGFGVAHGHVEVANGAQHLVGVLRPQPRRLEASTRSHVATPVSARIAMTAAKTKRSERKAGFSIMDQLPHVHLACRGKRTSSSGTISSRCLFIQNALTA